jgi:hypothetical protein
MADEKPLFNPNDGFTGRDGGPYLDEVQAQESERRRAVVEDREPDLENPGANAGIALATAAEMLAKQNVNSAPSKQNALDAEAERIFSTADEKVSSDVRVYDTINTAEVAKQDKASQEKQKEDDTYADKNLFDVRDELNEGKSDEKKPAAKTAAAKGK